MNTGTPARGGGRRPLGQVLREARRRVGYGVYLVDKRTVGPGTLGLPSARARLRNPGDYARGCRLWWRLRRGGYAVAHAGADAGSCAWPQRSSGRGCRARSSTAARGTAPRRHDVGWRAYPLISPGGYVVIDDYGDWQGARVATDEFRARYRIHTPLVQVDRTGRYWPKSADVRR